MFSENNNEIIERRNNEEVAVKDKEKTKDNNGKNCKNINDKQRNNKIRKQTKIKYSLKQKISLLMLAFADFMSSCSMSLMSPFYPLEASKKGMSDTMSGFVFGFFALIVFFSSPVFGKVIPKYGGKYILISGLLLSGISSIIFGLLDNVDDYVTFTVLSFLIRGLDALGASAFCTASYVLVAHIFPDDAGTIRGLLETFVGLGLCVGPALGGIFYSIGGFGLPFYIIGIAMVIVGVLNIVLIVKPEKSGDIVKTGSLKSLLRLPSVLITCLIMIVASMTCAYLDPTLEPHLRKFGLSTTQVGLMFLLLSATYGVFCPIWGRLTDKLNDYSWLMTTGLFCSSAVLLFLGPSPIFRMLKDSIWLNSIALSALGIFIAMALMPTYQFMLDCTSENGIDEESIGTQSVIAGLWSSVYFLGEVIGPVLGGILMEYFDFPITSTTFALINFIAGIFAFLYFKIRNYRNKTKQMANVDNIFNNNNNNNNNINGNERIVNKIRIETNENEEIVTVKF